MKLPSRLHWAVADSDLIQAATIGVPVVRGPKGRLLAQILCAVDRLGLTSITLFLAGLFELVRLWLRQGRVGQPQQLPHFIFVGFGAGAENSLYMDYSKAVESPPVLLKQTDVSTFGTWFSVGLGAALKGLLVAHESAADAVAQLPGTLQSRRLEFMTFAGMRLGQYAFMWAWFRKVHDSCPYIEEVCFLSPDTPAFAAVDVGLPTKHLQHGLIRRSLLLPRFRCVDASTEEEALHFRSRLPDAKVCVVGKSLRGRVQATSGILIASIYGAHEKMERILPFLSWASHLGGTIWVRPHPREDPSFWNAYARSGMVYIEDNGEPFEEALRRLQPRFVVSWYSTALVDALQAGILPVTIEDNASPDILDLVYPLLERTLRWPADEERISRLMDNDALYREALTALLSR